MARIDVYGLSEIKVARSDDHPYPLIVTIKGEDDATVRIVCDHLWSTAEELSSSLSGAASEMADILAGWEDTPDEEDGWVTVDRGRYYASLGNLSGRRNERPKSFPTREIAIIELAEAMTRDGYFPNAWFQDERGYTEAIDAEIRAFHDAGGDKMKPLRGVRYPPDTEIQFRDGEGGWWSGYVVRDYGKTGIVYALDGYDEDRFTDDRSEIRKTRTRKEDA